MHEIIVEIRGGHVRVERVPPGIVVCVRDYDVDGIEEERLVRDDLGVPCVERVYRGTSPRRKSSRRA